MKNIIISIVSALVIISILWIFYITEKDMAYNDTHGTLLRKDIGFKHGSPYIKLGDSNKEVFTLHPIGKDSAMLKSDVKSGDIVYNYSSIIEFYKALEAHRGKTIKFPVVDGGDGPPLKDRQQRIIELNVPK